MNNILLKISTSKNTQQIIFIKNLPFPTFQTLIINKIKTVNTYYCLLTKQNDSNKFKSSCAIKNLCQIKLNINHLTLC